jgi:hypothetical protein
MEYLKNKIILADIEGDEGKMLNTQNLREEAGHSTLSSSCKGK